MGKLIRLGKIAGLGGLNVRYASLVLPTGVVAYLAGLPEWMTVVAFVLLGLATAAELITSGANGVTAVAQHEHQQQYLDTVWGGIEDYANGGWLNGSEEEADDEEDGEGGASVPRHGR